MNMQTVGQATPVLLIQTDQGVGAVSRKEFKTDRAFEKYLRRQLRLMEEKGKDKKDDKKERTFSKVEMAFWLTVGSPIIFGLEVGIAMAIWKTLKASFQ